VRCGVPRDVSHVCAAGTGPRNGAGVQTGPKGRRTSTGLLARGQGTRYRRYWSQCAIIREVPGSISVEVARTFGA
jgi:hypothetical protein